MLTKELELTRVIRLRTGSLFECRKESSFEVCPKCARRSAAVYDRRVVRVKDAPIRGKYASLKITKRRFWCKGCRKPFTEPVAGISKGYRTTHRYRAHLLWACENFMDLKSVRRHVRCSNSSLYKIYYEQLELKHRTRRYPWPRAVGIDEHKFKRDPRGGWTRFVTPVVDHVNKRVFELVERRSSQELRSGLEHIPGRENVETVTMDLSSPYRVGSPTIKREEPEKNRIHPQNGERGIEME